MAAANVEAVGKAIGRGLRARACRNDLLIAPLLDRSVSVIPEPGTAILMALGLMLLATPPQTRSV